jgi:catechol 2,3-dioxygenase-like lactoylglutathione lyase family enzyme
MKRLHVHVAVADLGRSIQFYSTLFGSEPSVSKSDYAKWMLDDPRVNFAISTRGKQPGLDHLGLQAEDEAELESIGERLKAADAVGLAEKDTVCCYAKSDKYWTEDPQGIRWENFLSHGESTTYSAVRKEAGEAGCCETEASKRGEACCEPKAVGGACCAPGA